MLKFGMLFRNSVCCSQIDIIQRTPNLETFILPMYQCYVIEFKCAYVKL